MISRKQLKKIREDAINSYAAAQVKLHDLEKQLAGQLLDLLQTVVDNGYDNQNKAIDDQIDLLDKKTQKEIDGINQSQLSEQQKVDRTKILNEREAAQKDVLQKKQKDNDIKKARFDRIVSVAKISGTELETIAQLQAEAAIAQAKAAALEAAALANPLLAPAAAAMQAAVGVISSEIPITLALSAAQIAAVLAQPIPAYAEGTDDHIGGWALVGDALKQEVVELPSGQHFLTPDEPTYMNLPQHTKVYPDVDDLLMAIFSNKAQRDEQVFMSKNTQSQISFEPVTKSIDNMSRTIVKAISNIPQPNIIVENPLKSFVRDGNSMTEYVNKLF